jgi:plastocyanin
MKHTQPWTRWFVLTAFATLAGCGGGGEPAEESESAGAGEAAEAGAAQAVDPATAGAVVGTVAFEGTPPEGEAIDMSEEPQCAEQHEEQPMRMPAVVGDDGGLQWVFVRVSEGLPDRSWGSAPEPVVLDQQGCEYHPHVLAVRTGQTIQIKNSDGLLHNINAQPEQQRGFNLSQPTDMTTERSFGQAEVMIPVRCDVHGWMEAYIGVQEHPYFAVTSEDGSYRIENLPPGDYVIETWHERYGTQTQNVTVAAQGEATADFTYSESMAAGAVVPMGEPIDLHDHAPASAGGE